MKTKHDSVVVPHVHKKTGQKAFKITCRNCCGVAFANTLEEVEKRKALVTCPNEHTGGKYCSICNPRG